MEGDTAMRQIVYAMQFEGMVEEVGEARLQASLRAESARLTSSVGSEGLQNQLDATDGGTAEFRSDVHLTGETSFMETGTIRFGEGNSLEFNTIGEGYIAPGPEDGLQHGSIMWTVTSGEGQFDGATGIITSNFTLSADGQAVDRQFGVIWVE
jgi:hypothetical protein